MVCVEPIPHTEDQSERKLDESFGWTGQNYMLYAGTYVNSAFVENETRHRRGI